MENDDMVENIQVCVRVRPLLSDIEDCSSWSWEGTSITLHRPPVSGTVSLCGRAEDDCSSGHRSTFNFDYLFYPEHTTEEIFENVVQKIATSSMEGFHGSVFTYGQTSSGKTFTMSGTDSHMGIIPLTVHHCFQMIHSFSDREFLFRVNYLEIYNEQVKDLLSTDCVPIKIQHDSKTGNTVLTGVKETVVVSPDHVLSLLRAGEAQRHVGSTDMNEKSSRSHTLFRLIIESTITGEEENSSPTSKKGTSSQSVRVSTLNLVDLAGSENAKLTNSKGGRALEAKFINQSLLTLSTIIHRLSEEKNLQKKNSQSSGSSSNGGSNSNTPTKGTLTTHLPYRDSKLTRLLQSSLNGNARIAVICTMSPSLRCCEESLQTLKFAERAKKVRLQAKINEILDEKTLLRVYREEIERLKKTMAFMQQQSQFWAMQGTATTSASTGNAVGGVLSPHLPYANLNPEMSGMNGNYIGNTNYLAVNNSVGSVNSGMNMEDPTTVYNISQSSSMLSHNMDGVNWDNSVINKGSESTSSSMKVDNMNDNDDNEDNQEFILQMISEMEKLILRGDQRRQSFSFSNGSSNSTSTSASSLSLSSNTPFSSLNSSPESGLKSPSTPTSRRSEVKSKQTTNNSTSTKKVSTTTTATGSNSNPSGTSLNRRSKLPVVNSKSSSSPMSPQPSNSGVKMNNQKISDSVVNTPTSGSSTSLGTSQLDTAMSEKSNTPTKLFASPLKQSSSSFVVEAESTVQCNTISSALDREIESNQDSNVKSISFSSSSSVSPSPSPSPSLSPSYSASSSVSPSPSPIKTGASTSFLAGTLPSPSITNSRFGYKPRPSLCTSSAAATLLHHSSPSFQFTNKEASVISPSKETVDDKEITLFMDGSGDSKLEKDTRIEKEASGSQSNMLSVQLEDIEFQGDHENENGKKLDSNTVDNAKLKNEEGKDREKESGDRILLGVSKMLEALKNHVMTRPPSTRNNSNNGGALNHLFSPTSNNGYSSEDGVLEKIRTELKLKEADNRFLQEELANKDRMLTMLTDGLREVEKQQNQWQSDYQRQLESVVAENDWLHQEIFRLKGVIKERNKLIVELNGQDLSEGENEEF